METVPTLTLDLSCHEAMERAATASFPNEACGILIGERTAVGWRVVEIVEALNISQKDPTRFFEIDPKALFEAHRSVRAAEVTREVIGYFHSHPHSTAVPSAFDRSQAHEAGKVWVILGGCDALGEKMDHAALALKSAPSIWDLKAWVSGQVSGAEFEPVAICLIER